MMRGFRTFPTGQRRRQQRWVGPALRRYRRRDLSARRGCLRSARGLDRSGVVAVERVHPYIRRGEETAPEQAGPVAASTIRAVEPMLGFRDSWNIAALRGSGRSISYGAYGQLLEA